MADTIPWADKANSLLAYEITAHNSARGNQDGLVRAGEMAGGAIILSLVAEFALKALLEVEGTQITKGLRTHDLYRLFTELQVRTRNKASRVYSEFVRAESDIRVHRPPTDSLISCLKAHDDAFTKWRYDLGNAGQFYPMPMRYAAISLATFASPQRIYEVRSATSAPLKVVNGKTERGQG